MSSTPAQSGTERSGRKDLSEQAAKGRTSERAARLMRLATYASVASASLLIVVKLGAWIYTDSISLLSTLLDSV